MIRETCVCGATFEAQSRDANAERVSLRDWRKNHRHIDPQQPVMPLVGEASVDRLATAVDKFATAVGLSALGWSEVPR